MERVDRVRSLIIMSVLGLILAAIPAQAQRGGAIAGQIVACGGGVDHALVYIPGRSFVAITGATGEFELSNVPAGAYDVTVEIEARPPVVVPGVAVATAHTTDIGQINVADVASDPNNCGSCGTACSANDITPTCVGGICAGTCSAGFADCNNNKQADGCETNLLASVSNCGACGIACSANNITPTCASGTCAGTCTPGFADCNNNKRADGCETNTASDSNNCGGCGTACSANNIARACSNGLCTGTCYQGFADCNNNKRADGCETNLLTSVSNCGACGNACSSSQTCNNGVCS